MFETTTIKHDVSAPFQSNTEKNKNDTKLCQIDELISAVDDFKAKLKDLTEASIVIGRKVREVSIKMKQSERIIKRSMRSFVDTPATS